MLRNIAELQLIWSRWKPQLYKPFDIEPDRIIDDPMPFRERAIAAFSGGVDATFTVLRHTTTAQHTTRHKVTDVLAVHGFDIDLENSDAFDRHMARVAPLLDHLGLESHVVRTNSKKLRLQNWEDSFALELAGCMHLYAPKFGYGLIGSSEPYEALVLPWGSSPVTDHLMSGGAMKIVHDGAGFSRTDKVAQIARSSLASNTLKVCWQGSDQSVNCGVCEKCLRTKMNFLATGSPIPPSLPHELDLAAVARMKIRVPAQMAELEGIRQYAEARGVAGAWLPVLRARIKKGLTRPAPSPLERLVKRSARTLGLEDQVRNLARRMNLL
jgi:hypothetical protein